MLAHNNLCSNTRDDQLKKFRLHVTFSEETRQNRGVIANDAYSVPQLDSPQLDLHSECSMDGKVSVNMTIKYYNEILVK